MRADPLTAPRIAAFAAYALCGMLGASGTAAAASPRCHIHPPDPPAGNGPSGPAIIGPFDGRETCEAARSRLFGDLGRCHCTGGFTPNWLRDAPATDRPPSGMTPVAPLP
jgi:hypothetical protein